MDLYPIVSKHCAFKGAYDFKLKNITESFASQGLLDELYSENDSCQTGTDTIDIYENYKLFRNINDKNTLIKYNRLDCMNLSIIVDQLILTKKKTKKEMINES